jgi:hypothetical protein
VVVWENKTKQNKATENTHKNKTKIK